MNQMLQEAVFELNRYYLVLKSRISTNLLFMFSSEIINDILQRDSIYMFVSNSFP